MRDISAVICWITEQVSGARAVWFFGSRINGRARKDSDLDVIVESDAPKFTLRERVAKKRESRALFGVALDIVVVRDCDAFVKSMRIPRIEQVYIASVEK